MEKRLEKLLEKHNYLNKTIKYLRCGKIFEYDLKNAGFSVIKAKSLLSKDLIEYIDTLDKKNQNIVIGKLSTEYTNLFSEILNEFILLRNKFVIKNNLEFNDILSIKKDAIFTFKQCNNLQIGENYSFIKKNEYSSYLYIDNKEFYYNFNKDTISIKGLSNLNNHISMINFIKKSLRLMEESENKLKIFNYLKKFKEEYINGQLDISYYREMNNNGLYRLEDIIQSNATSIYLNYANNSSKEFISNRYNYVHIIQKIIEIML